MFEGDHFQLLARYNRWMNQKLFRVCDAIPDADRKRDMGAFFQSIHGTLVHIYYGDTAWMNRFSGRAVGVDPGAALHADFTRLHAARRDMDEAIVAWADRLETPWLSAAFEYTSNVDGRTRVLSAWILVVHMFNHQTHHRGQVTTLIKQLGYDPGVTDIPWLPELDALDAR